jgi:hypothetical protein
VLRCPPGRGSARRPAAVRRAAPRWLALGEAREYCWLLYLAASVRGARRAARPNCASACDPAAHRGAAFALCRRRPPLQKKLEAARPWRASVVHALLAPWPREIALYVWARTTSRRAAEAARDYIAAGASVVTDLKGRDLLALGYRPGPLYRETLAALLAERLEGRSAPARRAGLGCRALPAGACNGCVRGATPSSAGRSRRNLVIPEAMKSRAFHYHLRVQPNDGSC